MHATRVISVILLSPFVLHLPAGDNAIVNYHRNYRLTDVVICNKRVMYFHNKKTCMPVDDTITNTLHDLVLNNCPDPNKCEASCNLVQQMVLSTSQAFASVFQSLASVPLVFVERSSMTFHMAVERFLDTATDAMLPALGTVATIAAVLAALIMLQYSMWLLPFVGGAIRLVLSPLLVTFYIASRCTYHLYSMASAIHLPRRRTLHAPDANTGLPGGNASEEQMLHPVDGPILVPVCPPAAVPAQAPADECPTQSPHPTQCTRVILSKNQRCTRPATHLTKIGWVCRHCKRYT